MKPLIVTGWTDLGFRPAADQPKCLSRDQFAKFRDGILEAVGEKNVCVFWDFPYDKLWVPREFDLAALKPDTPTPMDRFTGSWQHLRCNAWQHERTTFAMAAAKDYPEYDVMIWLDIGILKQGAWLNNCVTKERIKRFFDRVANTPGEMNCIPFPGITATKENVYSGNNSWRFVGSTHIWPVKYLTDIHLHYKGMLRVWVARYKTLPLDLPIWALTEQISNLPFKWYPAEYDASQLDNYPMGDVS